MSKFVISTSVTVAILASFFTFVPSLLQYVSSAGIPPISEEDALVHTLAAAQNYTSTTIFTDPLVIYLDNFLSAAEIGQLLNDSSTLFVASHVFTQDPESPQHRTSSSCSLPLNEHLPSVVSTRALSFLDSLAARISPLALPTISYYGLEPLQLVKYAPSQYYHHHVDWFDALVRDDVPSRGRRGKGQGRLYNRVASFFIYLEDECVGGGTEFPDLKLDDSAVFAQWGRAAGESSVPQHADSIQEAKYGEPSRDLSSWKERVEIADSGDQASQHTKGTTFKPRRGSGVFWINLQESGLGDPRVRHAGLPVREGQKTGMNIWVKRDFGW